MMKNLLIVVINLLFLLIPYNALRILVSFPMASKSHHILGTGVVNHLLEAGLEVVFITSYPNPKPIRNLKEIDVSPVTNEIKREIDDSGFKLQNLVGKGNIGDKFAFMYFVYIFNKKFLEHKIMTDFLSDRNEKFDAVILEWFFSETAAGIPPLFECPLIWMGSTEAHGQILRVIDEVPNPAYNADLFSTNVPPFTFWQRITELWSAIRRQFIVNFIIAPFERAVYNDVFPKLAAARGVSMPPYDEAIYNASLMLMNSDPSVGTAFRFPQNVKYIGGYHIDVNVKPLPEDLQTLMDKSKNGVIYFSMGSNLKSMDMSDRMKETLLKTLGTLKEDVIWKFEGDLKDVPDNVNLVQWAPQQSILAHPNLKLFITHGGQLSTTEAIYFGVPMVGIPVLGDQFLNMRSAESKGYGITVNLAEDMGEELKAAIQQVLGNPDFKNKAEFLSSVYHHRLNSPGKELVHWVEHVVKSKGAHHLRSKAVLLPWYQKLYIAEVFVMVSLILVLCYSVKCIRGILKKESFKEKVH